MKAIFRGIVAVILVALLIWAGFAVYAKFFAGEGDDLTVPKFQEHLTVSPSDVLPAAAQCQVDEFSTNSLAGAGQKWSDAVSTPFESSDKKGMFKEVLVENCQKPTVLDMNIQALSNITIDGWNVGSHNPWMADFIAKAEKDGLRTAFLTKKEGVEGIFVTAEYQQYAAMTNTLLIRWRLAGVKAEKSVSNWHLPGGGQIAGELARTRLNSKQENLPVLRLELTEKGVGCIFAIGFNTGDKRFETLRCNKPQPKKTRTTTPTSPPRTTPPPPKKTCPPGQVKNDNGVCVTPKSSDRDDYIYPVDKPPAPKPTKPPVVTKPTPRPTPPPPNEGGGDDNVGDPGPP